MPTIAPWLRPTDVLGAMQSGASLGLQKRSHEDQFGLAKQQFAQQQLMDGQNTLFRAQQMQQNQQSAADQLQLNYDQLWEQSRRAQDQQMFQAGDAAARLAQESARLALQAGRYDDAYALQENSQALQQSHYAALEEAARRKQAFTEDESTRKLNLMKKIADDKIQLQNDNMNARYELSYDRQSGGGGGSDVFGSPQLKEINSQIKIQSDLVRSKNLDPDSRARAIAQLQVLLGEQAKLTGMPLVQPQITTNAPAFPWSKETYSTNYVPGTASAALNSPAEGTLPIQAPSPGPQVDVEREKALRALQSSRSERASNAIRQLYRQKTGKDL